MVGAIIAPTKIILGIDWGW